MVTVTGWGVDLMHIYSSSDFHGSISPMQKKDSDFDGCTNSLREGTVYLYHCISILLMATGNPAFTQPVEVGSFKSHYLKGFIHPRSLFGISSINSIILLYFVGAFKWVSQIYDKPETNLQGMAQPYVSKNDNKKPRGSALVSRSSLPEWTCFTTSPSTTSQP